MSFSFDHSRDPTVHYDPLADRNIFLAPRRADRPNTLLNCRQADCPFCIENSRLTPDPVQQWPTIDSQDWKSRIIPNAYPVVELKPSTQGNDNADTNLSKIKSVHAAGVHEVVIESPYHIESVLEVPFDDWVNVWKLCQQRMKQLATNSEIVWATLFKNGGIQAGASLAHVHSQLIAIDRTPPTILTKCQQIIRQPNLYENILSEAESENRIVHTYKSFVAIVPSAPRQPFEVWLIRNEPSCFFHTEPHNQMEEVAHFTQQFVEALNQLIPSASYNWWLHQFPFVPSLLLDKAAAHWHWHLEVLPRIAPIAGFELGTGYHISTIPPDEAAGLLRETGFWKDPEQSRQGS
jgi:UDPglucose--hexose-1-phosphate uridylyltransferase